MGLKRTLARMRGALRPAPPQSVRYFVASPFKTATTTVGAALIRLGAGRREMPFTHGVIARHAWAVKRINRGIPDDVGAADWIASHTEETQRILAKIAPRMDPYDVFADAPFGHSHIHPFALKALHPTARFIWVNRPFEEWVASARAWEEAHPDVYPRHVDWQTDPGKRTERLRATWNRRHANFTRLAADYPDDCLEMDIADLASWDKLAAFCGKPAPRGAPAARNVSRNDRDS